MVLRIAYADRARYETQVPKLTDSFEALTPTGTAQRSPTVATGPTLAIIYSSTKANIRINDSGDAATGDGGGYTFEAGWERVFELDTGESISYINHT